MLAHVSYLTAEILFFGVITLKQFFQITVRRGWLPFCGGFCHVPPKGLSHSFERRGIASTMLIKIALATHFLCLQSFLDIWVL